MIMAPDAAWWQMSTMPDTGAAVASVTRRSIARVGASDVQEARTAAPNAAASVAGRPLNLVRILSIPRDRSGGCACALYGCTVPKPSPSRPRGVTQEVLDADFNTTAVRGPGRTADGPAVDRIGR